MRRAFRLVPLLALCAATSGCAAAAMRTAGAMRRPDPAQMLQKADTNGDGIVTRAEFTAARDRLFTRLDRNGDGYLTKDDAPPRLAARRKGQGSGLAQAMAMLDKDGDGRVSRAEFVDGPGLIFQRADTNHDGVVDAAELAAFRSAVTARRGQ